MPAIQPQPNYDALGNYPPAIKDAIRALYDQGLPFWLTLPIAFGTADAAALYTVPAGQKLYIHRALWQITTSFSGGSSSAIGLSTDATGYATKGDILGGATGDVAATLVSTAAQPVGGTLGAMFGSNGAIALPAGKIVRFDRITSVFTAGAGFVHLNCSLLPAS